MLRIHASREADPYFLHTLEVTEDDFQGLKAEQGILVDFASFPTKLIGLLERCIASAAAAGAATGGGRGSESAPSFSAVLSVGLGESCLRIMETNDFKQLPHISLNFRPGTDFTVKQARPWRGNSSSDGTMRCTHPTIYMLPDL